MSKSYGTCKRCGRKLTSKVSQKRGYGSYCYSKMAENKKNDNEVVEGQEPTEELDGRMDIVEEVRKKIKEGEN